MSELPEGKLVLINEKEFNFSLASSGLELMKGLGGITSIEPYDGMLFDFGQEFSMHMWAKNLKFPIDLAFLDSDGKVMEIGHLALDTESSFTPYTLRAAKPGRYALEAPAGFFDENNIVVGTVVTL